MTGEVENAPFRLAPHSESGKVTSEQFLGNSSWQSVRDAIDIIAQSAECRVRSPQKAHKQRQRHKRCPLCQPFPK